jgi:hypothetical protein
VGKNTKLFDETSHPQYAIPSGSYTPAFLEAPLNCWGYQPCLAYRALDVYNSAVNEDNDNIDYSKAFSPPASHCEEHDVARARGPARQAPRSPLAIPLFCSRRL